MVEKRVLVVDDEPIVRESIADWLTDAGYEVSTTDSGEKALELAQGEDFGVMILDIRLPGRTGIRVLKEIQKRKPEVKAIVITAYPSELAAEAIKLGAMDCLIKPIAPDDLEKLVQRAIQSKTDEIQGGGNK